ncbi:MAG: deoxyribonuclease IV [Bacilli bacterium]|nr:deoxyribonuclease IV [Bacilli bacterium]
MILGNHVSFKNDTQLIGSVKEALEYNANCFMFYTGAPQNTKRNEIDLEKTKEAYKIMEGVIDKKNIIVHAPYIINLANKKNEEFNISFLKEEIKRVQLLGLSKIVLHPGSHVTYTKEEGLKNIVDALNKTLDKEDNIYILLETMAGKGSELASNLSEIKYIIDNVILNDKLMVCIDTCHLNDSGYDIKDFDKYLIEFDKTIGLNKIGCIHVNDSKNILSSKKDRHENIGYGTIGFDNLINVIYNEKLKDVPKILETPYVSIIDSKDKSYPPYKFEIEMIKNKKFNPNLLEDIRNYYK